MKESARTGISYIRSVSREHGIEEDFFKNHDIHIHIPRERFQKTVLPPALPWPRP